ncbi:uncharacterized protein LOC109830042 isoform X2 [Asparagus officinalis]|nr:uncharacterized protein LOC109830042 isoform X2 [Asparagus officinalis]
MQEQHNGSEFEVKDVQYIHAEVKLVKCLIQNIVVDISFNQSGGLSTLCFLEQVDRLIGKDHLFKRSIILIKAWCYYESRILGAHHGLISTYALETLVLYIFHLFHTSLDGPLAVLYRFLDYYSKFDWDKYCISLCGPILLSSLPELVAEAPENNEGDLLFTKEFLNNCVDDFSVLPRGYENISRTFPLKHLNIVDPLKENNNLGRSVSRGNFYRIRSAFSYGARKLGHILLLPSESIAAEIISFFANTLDRHGSGERANVQDSLPNDSSSPSSELLHPDANEELCYEMNAVKLSGSGMQNGSKDSGPSNIEGTDKHLISTSESNKLPNRRSFHVPHPLFLSKNGYHRENDSSISPLPSNEEVNVYPQADSIESESTTSDTLWLSPHRALASSWNTEQLGSSQAGGSSLAGSERNGASSKSKKLADLSADFDLHIRNLLYVQWSQEYILSTLLPIYSQAPYQYHNKNSWDHPPRGGAYSPTSSFVPGAYSIEDLPKPRGTGTYFPNMNYHNTYKERHSPRKGKSSGLSNQFSRHRSNPRAEISINGNLEERCEIPVFGGSGRGKGALPDAFNSSKNSSKETSPANSFAFPAEGGLNFGSFGPVPLEPASPESIRRLDPINPPSQDLGLTISASSVQRNSPSSNHERSAQAYQLKDEGDFPPLSG